MQPRHDSFIERLLRKVGRAAKANGPRDVYLDYEEHVARLIVQRKMEPRFGVMRKGQALIWAANLLHGGAPQRDRNRSRHSQVTHYFFEGCRYYTPILSRGEKIAWRNPDWIT